MYLTVLLALAETTQLGALQHSLNNALPNDRPMLLIQGEDFEAPAGAVIFLSYEEGLDRLVALARSGKDEVSVLFLPRWDAWVIETEKRTRDSVEADIRYANAAIASEDLVWFGHTHNGRSDNKPKDEAEKARWLRMYTPPSDIDLQKICSWSEPWHSGEARGFVASPLGVMEFWLNERPCLPFITRPEVLSFAKQRLSYEALFFKTKLGETPLSELEETALAYRGIFSYRFRIRE